VFDFKDLKSQEAIKIAIEVAEALNKKIAISKSVLDFIRFNKADYIIVTIKNLKQERRILLIKQLKEKLKQLQKEDIN